MNGHDCILTDQSSHLWCEIPNTWYGYERPSIPTLEEYMSQAYIDFAFVKENASFERVLAHYNIECRGTGVQRSVRCPFHHPDKKPSCRIEIDRNIWHCFACEASGNILEFVARMEGDADDLRASAAKIADICKMALAPPRPGGKAPDK